MSSDGDRVVELHGIGIPRTLGHVARPLSGAGGGPARVRQGTMCGRDGHGGDDGVTPSWYVHFDLRSPSFGAPIDELYDAALEMAAYADANGAAAVVVSEHHGVADGYLPSALTMAAAVAARTSSCVVSVNALPLTLHDPVSVAEQVAVVDLVARGRLALTVVPGYVPAEFAMFGVDGSRRGALLEEKLGVLRRALAGEVFEWQGRPVAVTPAGRAPVVLVGGASPAAARRAARLGDGFSPTRADPRLVEAYAAERARLGKDAGFVAMPPTPLFVHVAHDAEAAWVRLRPHAEHELASYRAWSIEDPGSPYAGLVDADAGRAAGLWEVATPEAAAAIARRTGALVVKPLVAGLDPDVGWASLRALVDEVVPALRD